MTVRRAKVDFRILAMIAVIALPLSVAGCTSSPEPYFGWETQGPGPHKASPRKAAPRHVAVVKPTPRPNYAGSRDYCSYPDPQYDNNWQRPKPYNQPAEPEDDYGYSRKTDYNYDANVRFQWPVNGRVVADYGRYPGGERNNGINIAAKYGTPIRAAADGTVSYSGNELRNYGNLVLIKHGNGYVTAYAHAEHFVVGKGERVARGQVIGYVGQSGDVRTPQLHFELRRGSHGETPIDPRPLLGPLQVAYR